MQPRSPPDIFPHVRLSWTPRSNVSLSITTSVSHPGQRYLSFADIQAIVLGDVLLQRAQRISMLCSSKRGSVNSVKYAFPCSPTHVKRTREHGESQASYIGTARSEFRTRNSLASETPAPWRGEQKFTNQKNSESKPHHSETLGADLFVNNFSRMNLKGPNFCRLRGNRVA
jgi:hypothetical protein